ncbi:hypothetical protein [Streptomyces sp. NPDC051561]
MYTTEMAYARMRELQELADRSRAHRPTPFRSPSVRGITARLKRATKQG